MVDHILNIQMSILDAIYNIKISMVYSIYNIQMRPRAAVWRPMAKITTQTL